MELSFFAGLEAGIIEWLQSYLLISPVMVQLMSFFTFFGDTKVLVVPFIYLYFTSERKDAVKLGIKLMFTSIFNSMLKNLVFRKRPYFDHENIKCLMPVDPDYDVYDIYGQGYSFPSGHTSAIASLFAGLSQMFRDRRWLVCGSIPVFLVMLSRVALGNHYPSDVLAGLLEALLLTVLIDVLYERLGKKSVYLLLFIFSSCGLLYCTTEDFFQGYGTFAALICADLLHDRIGKDISAANRRQAFMRMAVAVALFLGVSALFKLIIGDGEGLLCSIRYFASCFSAIGLYPIVFTMDAYRKKEGDQHE